MFDSVFPLANILSTFSVCHCPLAIRLVVLKCTCEVRTIRVIDLTESVSSAVKPRAFVLGAVWIDHASLTMFQKLRLDKFNFVFDNYDFACIDPSILF